MFFTQEDYRKIEKWLLANSRKDTDFVGAATPLKGNETVVLVQNGKNVKASVKDVVEQLFLLGVSDFVNITDKYGESYISLSQAIELIPYRSRKVGQVVTFLDDTGKWSMYQFQGLRKNQWNTLSLWVDLIDLMKGMTVVDSEDIVTEVNSANQVSLKFANKTYNEADFSGLGRIYLRKNIVDVEDPVTGNIITMNLLQQSMISKENTIYIIQYDYNLNKQTITIPSGCVLLFEGGSISNGSLNGVNTTISANSKVFYNIEIIGTWDNSVSYSKWFDFDLTGNTDNTNLGKSLFKCSNNKVIFEEGIYKISEINITSDFEVEGYNTTLKAVMKYPGVSSVHKNIFTITQTNFIKIHGIKFEGDISIKWTNQYIGEPLIYCIKVNSVDIKNCIFCNTTGYFTGNSTETLYEGQIITCRDCNEITISECELYKHVKTEHIWITTHENERDSCNVTFKNNYIHDLTPIDTIVGNTVFNATCNNLIIDGNRIENCVYTGSLFNAFGTNVTFKRNTIKSCVATSVVDNCEYGEFKGKSFVAEDNYIDCINAIAFLIISDSIMIRNNQCKCLSAVYAINSIHPNSTNKDGYKVAAPSSITVIIEDNIFDLTNFSSTYPYPSTSYRNGIAIDSTVYPANNISICKNDVVIRKPDDIDKSNRQLIVLGNCKNVKVSDNTVDTNIAAFGSSSANGFILYRIYTSLSTPIDFNEGESVIIENNQINAALRVFIFETDTLNIDYFVIDSLKIANNTANQSLNLSVSGGYIRNLIENQAPNQGLGLTQTEYAPIYRCSGNTEHIGANLLGKVTKGYTYLYNNQVVEVSQDCCVPKFNLADSIGETLRAGSVVSFGNTNFIALSRVTITNDSIPAEAATLPIEGILNFMGIYWLKVYPTGPVLISESKGNNSQVPVLDANLIGHRFFNTSYNQWQNWDGEAWRNEDETLVSKVVII